MPERALVLPVPARSRHRRRPVLNAALDITARAGSLVVLSALLVVAGAAAGAVSGEVAPASTGEHVVTFEIAGHH